MLSRLQFHDITRHMFVQQNTCLELTRRITVISLCVPACTSKQSVICLIKSLTFVLLTLSHPHRSKAGGASETSGTFEAITLREG